MDAVILAGGLGTRLRGVVDGAPKPMAEVNGRPFICNLLDHLSAGGVGRVVLSTGYMHEAFEEYFGGLYRGMEIVHLAESEPLGTGGAVRKALGEVTGEDFLILNGDSFFPVDISAFTLFHRSSGAVLSICVRPMDDLGRYGSVVVEGARVRGFKEKVCGTAGYINGGVYMAGVEIGEYFRQYANLERFSFETDFLEKNADSMEIPAFVSDSYFIDIGIPEDYAKARTEMGRVLTEVGP